MTCGVERLALEHVERRTRNAAVLERLDQRGLVHERAAPQVDEHCARLHALELGAADDPARLRRMGCREHHPVRAREHLGEALAPPLLVRGRGVGRRVAAHREDREPQRARARRDRGADGAQAHEPEGRALELTEVRRLAPQLALEPAAVALGVAGAVELAHEGEQDAERVLGHGRGVEPAAVGQDHGALDQRREEQRAHARGRDLDPAQAFRAREVLGAHRPAEHDVRPGQHPVGFGPVGGREEADRWELALEALDQPPRQVPGRLRIADELEHREGFHMGHRATAQPPARAGDAGKRGTCAASPAWLDCRFDPST